MLTIFLEKTGVQVGTAEYYNIVMSLCQMFEEIDVNCDGGLDWSELLQFLMSQVEQSESATLDLEAL
jgi:hypothetical protein